MKITSETSSTSKNTIDLSSVTTYGELLELFPPTGKGRVPGIDQLRETAAMILHRECGFGAIEIYDNGFFSYEEYGHLTVYGIDRCEWPKTYQLESHEKLDFSSYPWEMILEAAGSARLSNNSDSREEYYEDLSIDAPESENNIVFNVRPEFEIREEEEDYVVWRAERFSRMREAIKKPTPRQQEIAMMYFRDNMTQEDIAAAISKSQPYVSKTIRRFIEIVNEDFDSSKK